MVVEHISRYEQIKTFEMLWFNDVLETFKENGYEIRYTNSSFFATKQTDNTTQFKIRTINNIVVVTIPFSQNTEYTTEFSDYWKATEFVLYHLKEQVSKYH